MDWETRANLNCIILLFVALVAAFKEQYVLSVLFIILALPMFGIALYEHHEKKG